jgi:hypothetical protein
MSRLFIAGARAARMSRIFLIVVGVGVVALAIAMGLLGAFPPEPSPKPVEKTLPNERFQGR